MKTYNYWQTKFHSLFWCWSFWHAWPRYTITHAVKMGYLHAFGVSRRNRVERRYLPSAKFGLSRFISDISVPFWPQIVIFGVFKQIYLGCLRFTRTADVFSSMVSLHRDIADETHLLGRRSMTSVRWHSFSTSAESAASESGFSRAILTKRFVFLKNWCRIWNLRTEID